MSAEDILMALFDSFYYVREDIIPICIEVKNRILKINCTHTDEGNIIFSTLVLLYGDYGIGPYLGWFHDEELEKRFVDFIDSYINLMEEPK